MYEIGDTVDDFTLESTNGTYTLSERVQNNYALLYFYVVNFGKTCTDYMALMNERLPELQRRGVELVHINPESIENHKEWMRSTAAQFEHLSDKEQTISKKFDCIVTNANNKKIIGNTNRALFLIDKDMRIRYCWRAEVPHDTVPMDELIMKIDEAIP